MTAAGVGQAAMEETAGGMVAVAVASGYGDLTGLVIQAVPMDGVERVERTVQTADDRANRWPERWFIA